MIITIISQGSFSEGHQVIAFEWAHNEPDDGGSPYRKHKVFHLYPALGQSAAPNELGLVGSALKVVPGRIERNRAVARGDDGVAHSVDKGRSGNASEAQNSMLTKNGKYRSWKVPFADGWKAFVEAKRQWKTANALPSFNLTGKLAHNCSTWALSIASIAGINATEGLGWLGFIVSPKDVVQTGAEIKSETEMWDSRHA